MQPSKNADIVTSVRPFRFESYGVKVEIISNEQNIIDQAAQVCRKSLVDNVRDAGNGAVDHYFELPRTRGGTYRLIQNQNEISYGRSRKKFFKFFDSIIRVAIGEYAVDRVFLHAGVVGWNGKAIVMPADSFKGKTTLVAELVRNGATYYSDEFAVFDKDAIVHPFPRPLSMRTDDGRFRPYELTVEDLGGTYGEEPIPVGMVLLTGYQSGQKWRPKILSPGNGVLEMIPYTLPIRYRPDFSISVLNNIASRAIIASGLRGTAETFTKTLLTFVDKHLR
jgi:hypothetical protein